MKVCHIGLGMMCLFGLSACGSPPAPAVKASSQVQLPVKASSAPAQTVERPGVPILIKDNQGIINLGDRFCSIEVNQTGSNSLTGQQSVSCILVRPLDQLTTELRQKLQMAHAAITGNCQEALQLYEQVLEQIPPEQVAARGEVASYWQFAYKACQNNAPIQYLPSLDVPLPEQSALTVASPLATASAVTGSPAQSAEPVASSSSTASAEPSVNPSINPSPSPTPSVLATPVPLPLSPPEGHWQSVPEIAGGDILSLALEPGNSQVIYAATANGGLYKSPDGGKHFVWSAQGLPVEDPIQSLLIPVDQPQTILAASASTGIYRSQDGGLSWNLSAQGLPSSLNQGKTRYPNFKRLLADPDQTQVIYLASSDFRHFRSNDGGQSWQELAGLPESKIYALTPGPADLLYAAGEVTTHLSTNNGQTWLPTALNQRSQELRLVPQEPDWVLTDTALSTDRGQSWSQLRPRENATQKLYFDPFNPERLFTLHSLYQGLSSSQDRGKTWKTVPFPGISPPPGIRALYFDPLIPGRILALAAGKSGQPKGLLVSEDGGMIWNWRNQGLSAHTLSSLAYSSTTETLFAGTLSGEGLFVSSDQGTHWQSQSIQNLVTQIRTNPDGKACLLTQNAQVFCRTSLQPWFPLALPSGFPRVNGLALSADQDRIYLDGGTQGVMFRNWDSTDWQNAPSLNTLPGGKLFQLSQQPDSLWLSRGSTLQQLQLYRWFQTEANWQAAGAGLSKVPSLLQQSASHPQIMYISLFDSGYPNQKGGFYRSENAGQSWVNAEQGLGSPNVTALAIHPENPSLIFVGTWDQGVYKSSDGGRHWSRIQMSLPDPRIRSLLLIPGSPERLFAGTFGSGLWVLASP